MTIEGARVFTPREIEAALPFKPGAPWEARQAEDGQRAIERLYATRGYYGAVVRLDTSRQRLDRRTSATTSTRARRPGSDASSSADSCSRARTSCGGCCRSGRATC